MVKIDKSFVDPLDTDDARSRTVIATMISLSKKLGFRVVAEGVETVGAVDTLTRMACDEAQGYVFARPLEAQDVLPWIARFNGDDQMPPLPHREAA
ncbi:EAL domain-containing protein [Sphingomonas sp. T1]|uniref:EAL domain-containing protein n=1 Tax=Sphingomonas sp. T1 TaxID=2653172 RepID=UPI0022A795FB|nr:EAL domain-containing protein [Sphingomonas sp. T1]